MLRAWPLLLAGLLTLACTPSIKPADASDSAKEMASWPAPESALTAASAAMSQLQSMREQVTTRTYRNEELFLGIDAERAYVAPDRRYERIQGRSSVEVITGETVQIGARFFKRLGEATTWEEVKGIDTFVWPSGEYQFDNPRAVSYAGAGDVDGRPARILVFSHQGNLESRNAGWEFQTRLWIDPKTNYFLRRESRGSREEPGQEANSRLLQRYEGTWIYQNHNASISISEPPGMAAAE